MKRLRRMGKVGTVREQTCQGADRKADTLARGALERGHDAALEPVAQLSDAHRSVGAAAVTIDAAELVVGQTAKGRGGVSMWALT